MTHRSAVLSDNDDRDESASSTEADAATPVFDSECLLRGGREIVIRHGDACYRLRHTRNDKLILTK